MILFSGLNRETLASLVYAYSACKTESFPILTHQKFNLRIVLIMQHKYERAIKVGH